ncbi:MAG: MFS transporter [Bauldia sp.]|nr:MFS transporter [Bauldia sp.]
MTNPYADIFRARGAAAFSAAGFLARLSLPMVTLGIVTMLSQTQGRYAIAGAVAATFAVTNALVSPRVSRLIDRHGQARVVTPVTVVAVVALLGLVGNAFLGGPDWLFFVFALFAGLMPSMAALVRARWTALYRGTPRLHTAFAFESLLDELTYMFGSVLAIGLSLLLFPEAGPLAAALFLALGTTLFVMQRRTEPLPHPHDASSAGAAIRIPAVRIIALMLLAVGVIFGTAEVSVIAYCQALGEPGAASLVLAGYSLGSLTVGIVYGLRTPRMPLARQLVVAMVVVLVTTLPPLLVWNVGGLAVALFLAGGAISPTFITAFGLIERLVPGGKLTEGITWAMTGIGLGMALGTIGSGHAIDAFGAQNGFWISVVAGLFALFIVIYGYAALAGRDPRGERTALA